MRGIGFETTKNIILAGPRKVIIYDNNKLKINDLTSKFYINERHVIEGKRRDEATLENLIKINPNVKYIDIMKNDSIIEHIKNEKYDVVVINEFMEKSEIIIIDNYCKIIILGLFMERN